MQTRLAPSPTGALHLGNARTFLVNWALARQRGWRIMLRIEDLDGPRVKPEAAAEAIDVLRWLGLDWDEGPTYQRHDLAPYRAALESLAAAGVIYPCRCTRREIEAAALSAPHAGDHELRYPGTCRPAPGLRAPGSVPFLPPVETLSPEKGSDPLSATDDSPSAWRVKVPDGVTTFADAFAGMHEHDIQATTGDFLVATKEGLPSYQLAVVIDDARQHITHIVRGDDLLASTHRQRLLQQLLDLPPIAEYIHLPLVVGADGRRLAKRHGDTRISHYRTLGVSPERILGLLAEWCGLGPRRETTAAEIAQNFALASLSPRQTVFTPEDDAWLLGKNHDLSANNPQPSLARSESPP
jgi:glutamyl-tRNA synthetase